MKIYGKVLEIFPKERVIKLKTSFRIVYLYLQRKDFREYGPYFFEKPYLFLEVGEDKKRIKNYMAYNVVMFIRIIQSNYYTFTKRKKIYFDMYENKRTVRKLINNPHNKMFIDLEFTMPPIYQSMPTMAEIIQYGIIIENKKGDVVFKDSSLINPSRPYNLNKNTLKFLSLTREDFKDAAPYSKFYNLMKDLMREYRPKIYVWGSNDVPVMEQSFKYNKVPPLQIRANHVNLMNVIKNYNNSKEELGLFQTYTNMTNKELGHQIHDALEDASITREIFHLFKDIVNKDVF